MFCHMENLSEDIQIDIFRAYCHYEISAIHITTNVQLH